ncbi:MAG: DUF6427 family protein [Flavobacteriaceae bacterium]
MITAIFNKSKPINLVLASLLLVFGFVIVQLKSIDVFNLNSFLYDLFELSLAVLSVMIIEFIVKKNSISEQNSFVIMFFSIFSFCFWNTSETVTLLLSNLFVLLALRKIISLKTQTNTSQKIFDAGLWICVAALFHFWAILFFIVLYISIAFYSSDYYKNWLIPLVSVFVVFTMVNGYEMIVHNTFYKFSDTTIVRGFHDISSRIDIAIVIFFSLILMVSLFFLSTSVKTKLQKNKMSYVVLLFALLIAIIIMFLAPNKSVSMLLYAYFPLAVLFTVFFERIPKVRLQSIILYLLLFASVLLCLLS